ncbi:MAG: hypothetical protein AAF517_18980 [Planctomycetota bacterium]
MRQLLRQVFVLAFLLPIGCAYTHPRTSPEMVDRITPGSRVLFLEPGTDVNVQLIKTRRFVYSPELSTNFADAVQDSFRKSLEARELEVIDEDTFRRRSRRKSTFLDGFREALVQTVLESIAADPDHQDISIDERVDIPRELVHLGVEYPEVDFVVAIAAQVKTETERQFWRRWVGNFSFNLLTLPVSLASAFIPVTLPLSVNISTTVVETSPDEVFAQLAIVDLRDGRILYQNDYSAYYLPAEPEDFDDWVERLLEDFVPRPE